MTPIKFKNGHEVLNVSPYTLKFLDNGTQIPVPPSGVILPIKWETQNVSPITERVVATGTEPGIQCLEALKEQFPGVIFLGTPALSEAYDDVCYPKEAHGFEQIAVKDKHYTTDMFRVF